MARIIALANQKGGVGKTTTAINLGASIAACERKVLVVDIDPQANATSGLGFPKDGSNGSMYPVLVDGRPIHEVIRESELPGLYVASSAPDLVGAEIELADVESREFRLASALDIARGEFDYILIDSPPSLGLLTVNALAAADSVLIPIQCEYFALEGVSQLLDTVERVRRSLNPSLAIEGIVMTMADDRINLSRQVIDEARSYFGSTVFETTIPRNVRLGEAPSFGQPILLYDIRSRGSEAYVKLAKELIERVEKQP